MPNYSFEDTLASPMCFSQMILNKTQQWFNPSNSSPDYINVCANTYTANYPLSSTVPQTCYGHQYPQTGNAMVGIGTYAVYNIDSIHYFSEFISVKLTDTLKAGACYYGEFYAVLADVCEFNSNRLGMYLTQNTFTTSVGSFTNSIECQVQFDTTQYFTDTLNWVKISGAFTAQGGETYLTIGSFKDGTHVKKTGSTSGFNSLCNFSDDPHKIVYFYIDDVSLYACNPIGIIERDDNHKFKIYPNPAKEQLTIESDLKRSDQAVITIYNIMGEIVLSEKLIVGKTAINTTNLNNGTYLYRIIIDGNIAKADKLIIIK